MVSTFTPNIQLEEPARGDQVGTWDTPVNNNMTEIDLTIGAITTISLNNSPVVLAAAQYQSKGITFNSTLTGSVAITFPASFKKSYEIQNLCTGSSAFVITLATTAAAGQAICCPPGEWIECVNDGTNLQYKNLGRIGSFWDYGGSSVPAWVSGCTVPPYLNCTGATFSATTYPALAVILGSTTLPDSRGRFRATLNQTTGRLTSSQGGLDGQTFAAGGGSQTTTLSSLHLPQLIDPSHVHPVNAGATISIGIQAGGPSNLALGSTNTGSATTGITYGSSSQIGTPVVPPAYIGGITMIRSA